MKGKLIKTKMMVFVSLLLVLTMGVVSAQSNGNSALTLALATYDPIPAEPGQTIDVWITLQNNGDGDARGVKMEFIDTPVFTLVSSQDRLVTAQVIGAHSDFTTKYKVQVSDDAPEGENELLIRYSAGTTGTVEVVGRVIIDVKSTETPISVNSVEISPSPLSPGGKATLTLKVDNIARSSNLRNVDVVLQLSTISSGTIVVDLPFVTVNSGNQQTVDRIAPGQSAEFNFDIAAYPDAEAKIYKLPVTVSYYDDSGVQYEKTMLVGIEVNAKPNLLVTLESSDLNSNMNTGDVLFNIINKGTTNVKLMTLKLEESDNYEILSSSNELYLGNIDSDDFETARFNVKSNNNENVTFVITLNYMDSLNNEYTESYNVNSVFREPATKGGSSGLWIILLIVIAIVVFVVIRRRNRNKRD